MLLFLAFLLFVVLLYFGLRSVCRKILSKECKVGKQTGILSFDSLVFNFNSYELELRDFKTAFNLLSLFSSSYHLFRVNAGKIIIKELMSGCCPSFVSQNETSLPKYSFLSEKETIYFWKKCHQFT